MYLHYLPLLSTQLDLNPAIWASSQPAHILASLAVLAAPGAAAIANHVVGTSALPQKVSRTTPPFLDLAYGYLPLVFGATLVYYERYFMEEAGLLLQVAAATVGLGPEVVSALPSVAAEPSVTAFVQGSSLVATSALALALTRRLAPSWASVLPQCVGIVAFASELWYLVSNSR